MTNAFYNQIADKIFPIFGVASIEEAKEFCKDGTVIETNEDIYMNIATGSVDFASGWDDLDQVTKVKFDINEETWVEA